jgi:lysophospholipase L1-like esterase
MIQCIASVFLIEVKGMTTKRTKLLVLGIVIVFLVSPFVMFELSNLQNNKLQVAAVKLPIKVACVGDSITQITGYPADLQTMLGDNYSVGNFGCTGSTVLLNSWEPYMNQSQFQSALKFNPNIVIVMLGTNDDLQSLRPYNGSFVVDYEKLIDAFEDLNGAPKIYVAESPPIFSNSSDLSPSYLSNTIIPMTQDVAHQMGLPIIDVYDALVNHPDYFQQDGVHPNSQGGELIATEVYDAIVPLGGLNQTS